MIFLDIDDTLLDHTNADLKAAFDLFLTHLNRGSYDQFIVNWRHALEEQYARYVRKEISFQDQRRERIRQVINPSLTDETADEFFEYYLKSYERNWAVFPDVIPFLERYKNHGLGIISNGNGALQRKKLERTGLTHYFKLILISEECGLSKPDSRIFHKACELAEVAPEDAYYIGDRFDIDAEAAVASGLRGLWINRTTNLKNTSQSLPMIHSLFDFESIHQTFEANKRVS